MSRGQHRTKKEQLILLTKIFFIIVNMTIGMIFSDLSMNPLSSAFWWSLMKDRSGFWHLWLGSEHNSALS